MKQDCIHALRRSVFGVSATERGEVQFGIIAEGPIVKQPGTMPTRTVLRVWPRDSRNLGLKFVVHDQLFEMPDNQNFSQIEKPTHKGFINGSYFTNDRFSEAVKEFADRITSSLKYYESIYREES